MTDSPDKLTTDPPRPPGTPDVDDLIGDPVRERGPRTEPDDEDVTGGDPTDGDPTGGDPTGGDAVSVEPPD